MAERHSDLICAKPDGQSRLACGSFTSLILKSLDPFEQTSFVGTGQYETNCPVLSFQPLDLCEDGCERPNLCRATPIPEAGAKAGAGIPALSRLGADGASRFV